MASDGKDARAAPHTARRGATAEGAAVGRAYGARPESASRPEAAMRTHATHSPSPPTAYTLPPALARDDPAASLSAPPSPAARFKSLVISPNLHAALEYEERMRAYPASTSITQAAAGLPPPPRPRSTRGRKVSPTRSTQSSPTVSMAGPSEEAPPVSGSKNPFINPAPRLSFLLRQEEIAQTQSALGLPGAHDTNERETDARFHEDAYTKIPTPVSPLIPSGRELRRASTDLAKPSGKHNRYFSTLEKMLGMGKGKGSLGGLLETARRASEETTDEWGSSTGKEKEKSVRLRRGSERGQRVPSGWAASAPSSPTGLFGRSGALAGGGLAGGAAAAAQTTAPRPSGSHARQASFSSRTGSSAGHDHGPDDAPAAASTDPRISISSTIYTHNMHSDRESFIDLASPTFSPQTPYFDRDVGPALSPPGSPESNSSHLALVDSVSSKPLLPRLTTAAKPPVPTAPKPNFRRSRSAQPPARRSHGGEPSKPATTNTSPQDVGRHVHEVPPTTNNLNPRERADLVRKNQKLTQLFGQTPGVGGTSVLDVDADQVDACLPVGLNKRKHQRGAQSFSVHTTLSTHPVPSRGLPALPLDDTLVYTRHRKKAASLPDDDESTISFAVRSSDDSDGSSSSSEDGRRARRSPIIEIGTEEGTIISRLDDTRIDSPTSFIDLSDEEAPHTAGHVVQTPRASSFPRSSSPLQSPSLSEEQQAEEDRRRKRDKLAKLHRFLGSRVPVDLVLGPVDEHEGLPAPAPAPVNAADEEGKRRLRPLRRRRSSSAAEFAGSWSTEISRLKEDMDDREKALIVRRAVKMEKMFGVAPPQTLYNNRQPSQPGATPSHTPQPSPSAKRSPSSVLTPKVTLNINQSSYKKWSKKTPRPGSGDSQKPLIDNDGYLEPSDVYLHYRHSLNSLNDIIDRDDRQSLAELHDYLSSTLPVSAGTPPTSPAFSGGTSKADRRRSLPVRTSMMSLASEYSVTTPKDDTFQARRKTAAKLTQFFGVNYRELMNEILESIEKGLEDERGRGSLRPSEVQDLQQKLLKLKSKRDSFK